MRAQIMKYCIPLHLTFKILKVFLPSFVLLKIFPRGDGLLRHFHSFINENNLFPVLVRILGGIFICFGAPKYIHLYDISSLVYIYIYIYIEDIIF